ETGHAGGDGGRPLPHRCGHRFLFDGKECGGQVEEEQGAQGKDQQAASPGSHSKAPSWASRGGTGTSPRSLLGHGAPTLRLVGRERTGPGITVSRPGSRATFAPGECSTAAPPAVATLGDQGHTPVEERLRDDDGTLGLEWLLRRVRVATRHTLTPARYSPARCSSRHTHVRIHTLRHARPLRAQKRSGGATACMFPKRDFGSESAHAELFQDE